MYRPATLFQPSFLSKMVNSSELPFPSGQLQVAIDASLSEMANAEETGMAKESACRALKSLRDRGVLVERTNKLIPGIPIYAIDPGMFYCGDDESRKGALAAFHRDLKKASDAKRPNLTVVK